MLDQDRIIQAYRIMIHLAQHDPSQLMSITDKLGYLQEIAGATQTLRQKFQDADGWRIIRNGTSLRDVKVEHRHDQNGQTHSIRVECELAAPLDKLLIALNEVLSWSFVQIYF